MLESFLHEFNCFVTLTYSDEFLPKDGSLDKGHHQEFLKSLRHAIYPRKVRYFAVGEYGARTFRPHYHYALFGLPSCLAYMQNDFVDKKGRRTCSCSSCLPIRLAWSKGITDCARLEKDSAQYIAGYVTKKMTKRSDPRLGGRAPEFAQPSLKPGIGADAMRVLASTISDSGFIDLLLEHDDVPTVVGGLPLGRYLRSKLREYLGVPKDAGKGYLLRQSQELCALSEVFYNDSKNKKADGTAKRHFMEVLEEERVQKVLNCEAKSKIFIKKESL